MFHKSISHHQMELPSILVWRNILPYIPCMGITPRVLRKQFLMNRTVSVIRRCISLGDHEWVNMRRCMFEFDFVNEPCFEYQSDDVYLIVFFKNRRHDDYIVIYMSGR